MRRRSTVQPAGASKLFVIAGFPKPVDSAVLALCEQKFGAGFRFLTIPSRRTGAGLYPEKTVAQLLRVTAGFAFKQREKSAQKGREPSPETITLIYIRAPDEKILINAFSRFARIHPISTPDITRADWFNDYDLAPKIAAETIAGIPKLQKPGRASPQLLPLRNFIIDKSGKSLLDHFEENNSSQEYFNPPLEGERLSRDDLEVIPAGKKEFVYRDVRGLFFPTCKPTEAHALARELDETSSDREVLLTLQQLYRFGYSLEAGFHHDVQYARRSLTNEPFTCSIAGKILVSATHANVYPNDFIRASGTEKAPETEKGGN